MLALSELPPSPPFDRWVLEQPLPLSAACVVAGIAVMVALHRRGEMKRGALVGSVLMLVGVGVLALGMLIETPRERLRALTSEFVRRVFLADGDWAAAHLSDSLVVASAGEAYRRLGKAELVASIRNFAMFRAKEWSERSRGSVLDGDGIGRTQSTVRVTAGYIGNQMIPSTWEFTWRRGAGDQWQITRLECLTMWGQPPRMDWESAAINIARLDSGSGGLRPDAF
ncbi:MAG: hypothetical protein JNK58_10805 [Phycisphaerae bacterium]|nr:hypothetical protein [Phycisphaerae bacterium]